MITILIELLLPHFFHNENRYWDERYSIEDAEPFDWLFNFSDLKILINQLLPDKFVESILIGCGNAPFSVDMYNDGYTNILNVDYSTVVIKQQSEKYPHIKWQVANAMSMPQPDCSIHSIVDKSLIDTVLCYKDRYILNIISANIFIILTIFYPF